MIQQSATIITKWMKGHWYLAIESAVGERGQWVYVDSDWEGEDSELNKLRQARPLDQLPALMKEVDQWAEINGFKQTYI